MALSDVIGIGKSNGDIDKAVFKSLAGEFTSPPIRPSGWIPVRRVFGFCARREFIQYKADITVTESYPPGLGVIMDQGNWLADWWRDTYMGPTGNLYGAWQCSACNWSSDDKGIVPPGVHIIGRSSLPPMVTDGALHVDKENVCDRLFVPGIFAKMPVKCPQCGRPRIYTVKTSSGRDVPGHRANITFLEWTISDPVLRIRGKPDGYRFVDGDLIVQEIKTVGPNQYNHRVSPVDAHVAQIMIYMWMLGGVDGEIIYVNRSGWGNDYTAFWKRMKVEYDEDVIRKLLMPVKAFRDAQANDIVPVRTCLTKNMPRAKSCPIVDECFSSAW